MASPGPSSRRRANALISVSVGALSLAAACLGWGVPYEASGTACRMDAECEPGEICSEGVCRAICRLDTDCPETGARCIGEVCLPPPVTACETALDCTRPGQCQVADGAGCVAGRCEYRPRPVSVACIDNDPCTFGDACTPGGECAGVPVRCTAPPANTCNVANDEFTSYPGVGRCAGDTGECDYAPTVTPCPDCTAACRDPCAAFTCPDAGGGCQIIGVCIGGEPTTCAYSDADNGTPCDLTGSSTGTLDGHCFDGACSSCSTAAHCTEPPDGDLNCWKTECISGSCRYTPRADDTACADTTYTDWGPCGGFVGACGETGMQGRTATDWACRSGVCAGTDRVESQACARDTDGSSCGGSTYGSWSTCSDFSDACDTAGTQTRTVTTPTCNNGGCSSVVTTGTQSCTRATPQDGTVCGASSWQVCCSGACRDLRSDNSHCGGCGVSCASKGLTCRSTSTGGYACGACSADSTCRSIYDANATCWTTGLGGNDLCQCQCGPAGSGYAVCEDGGCGANMKCHACVGDNYCSPGGPGSCP